MYKFWVVKMFMIDLIGKFEILKFLVKGFG